MPRTGPITVGWREVERRAVRWRMRPPSEDGRDNRTRPERGPQGSGRVRGQCIARTGAGETVTWQPHARSDGQTGDRAHVAGDQAERRRYRLGKGRRELMAAPEL